ncbi:acyltransferase family protein [Mitsuaria sp. GD03876]|uniref:acyltransferase family protein n=1 Tax=Mitsuaria sp. GD03876 TaxID=2975399 RepID=UPI00244ACC74|nr:acyltransferase family protein [Mitsuaria sp. GD03876]MDH0867415.1 acyltransferase [Mitsuaria sp. GD03876]
MRDDIQALRAIAVLWVLLYHAQLPGASGGYLGVDIFFVISGYLITGLIQRALGRGDFSFRAFYGRRARRLLPAAYVVLGATLLAVPWALNRSEQIDFAGQLLGALGFANNVVLWRQTGYFQGASDLKPLLHFWSLALEEQYYLVLPALLVFSPARWRAGVAIAMTAASLALLAWWQSWDASGAFYLLPTRAWELGLGSIGALMTGPGVFADDAARQAALQRALRLLAWPAWALLLIVPTMPQVLGASHPGPAALVVNLATLVLLLREPARLPRVAAPLIRIGDWSYALYLVHWPLLAILHNAWVGLKANAGGQASLAWWRVGAVLLAFPLAWALHRAVERPAKALLTGRRGAMVLGSCTVALAVGGVALALHKPAPGAVDFVELRKPNYGLSANCDAEEPFDGREDCRTRPGARWMVWGDSYAMHLVPGLVRVAGDQGLVQATKSSCGPFPGVTPVRPELGPGHSFAPPWIEQCQAFNASVLRWLGRHPEIETVVLSSLLTQYLDEGKYELERTRGGERLRGEAAMRAALLADVGETVRRLRAMGKRVMVVAPPPSAPFDIAGCLERRQARRWTIGATPGCVIDEREDETRRAAETRFIEVLASSDPRLPVLRFEPLLCNGGTCQVERDGVPLYRDQGHLSREGSKLLMPAVMSEAVGERQLALLRSPR